MQREAEAAQMRKSEHLASAQAELTEVKAELAQEKTRREVMASQRLEQEM